MARAKPWEVNDDLWVVIEPLLPRRQRWFRHPGRERLDDRLALQGILFVLHNRDRLGAPATGAGLRLWDAAVHANGRMLSWPIEAMTTTSTVG
ncbi:hypothetical protein [Nonomuraea sp. LPB2021202275-12-8]|uniref:hypothetical protein n=1 Tax=Nonomuraea sp. LPB2021202275-12-8 TaxID=3120159 RepID=UPI003FA56CAB